MPATLTRVQRRNMSMLCNLYAPSELVLSGALVEGLSVEIALTNCPCRLEASIDANTFVDGLGASNVDQLDTTDKLRLPSQLRHDLTHAEVEPGDGWVMQITSGAQSGNGNWYAVVGAAQAMVWRGSVNQYLVKRISNPGLEVVI